MNRFATTESSSEINIKKMMFLSVRKTIRRNFSRKQSVSKAYIHIQPVIYIHSKETLHFTSESHEEYPPALTSENGNPLQGPLGKITEVDTDADNSMDTSL